MPINAENLFQKSISFKPKTTITRLQNFRNVLSQVLPTLNCDFKIWASVSLR